MTKISDIESWIDGVRPSPVRQVRRKPKRTIKMSKRLGYTILIVSICSALAVAGAYTYFMQTSSTHGVGRLWEIQDNSTGSWSSLVEMGDTVITWDTSNSAGGDFERFDFNISLSGNSNANKKIYFAIEEVNLTEGVDLTITRLDTMAEVEDGDFVEFTPDEYIEFSYVVTIDEYTPEGDYTTALTLTKN